MLHEFREFINRGNVVDLAVAFVMGAAFGTVVTAFNERLVMPLVALVVQLDGIEAFGRFGANGSVGAVIQAFLNFLIVSFAMFLVVRAYNRFRDTGAPEGPPEDVALLREIRDELRASGRRP